MRSGKASVREREGGGERSVGVKEGKDEPEADVSHNEFSPNKQHRI